MNKSLLKTLVVLLIFGNVFNKAAESVVALAAPVEDTAIEVDLLDAASIQKRMFLFALTSGVLLYAGYNLHDIVNAEHIQETDEQCKRSGLESVTKYTLDLTPKKMVRVGYVATFGAAVGYLWYIYGKSIVKYYAQEQLAAQAKVK